VLDKGSVIIGGIKGPDIEQAIELSREMKNNNEPVLLAPDYKDENVSVKVIKIIESYTKIVNKEIWRKS
jgi:UDP-N-acetylglucosamine 2-epimerase (non-hydrolysing)